MNNTRLLVTCLLALMCALTVGPRVAAAEGPDAAAAPPLRYSTSWIGNSFGGPEWVQKDGIGLTVASDGTCYVTAAWDENGKGIGIYRDAAAAGRVQGVSSADGAAAIDEHYAFFGTHLSAKNAAGATTLTYGISRWRRDGTPAPWDGGLVFVRNGGKNFLPVGPGWLAGACAYGGELFVGDPAAAAIRVFDCESMQEKRRFACPQPFRLAIDGGGFLWVIQRPCDVQQGLPAKLVQYNREGKPTGRELASANGAVALAADAAGRLLVAGPRQQVITYDVTGSEPRAVGVLGTEDGVYGGVPGEMAPDKLLGLWGVGSDAEGNIYTLGRAPATGGGVDLRKFSPAGKLLWQLVSTQFTDVGDGDPTSDGRDIYTRDEHFVLDFSKPAGQQWTWKGYTLDPRYDDGRVEGRMGNSMFTWGSPLVRRLDGRLYLYARPGQYLGIFRQGGGEVFVPSGLIDIANDWRIKTKPEDLQWPAAQPQKSRWFWRDRNGDGLAQADEFDNRPDLIDEVGSIGGSWVDDRGDIWLCGVSGGHRCLWHLPLQGFDAVPNPIYDIATLRRLDPPAEFLKPDGVNYHDVNGIQYQAADDVMILSGTTPAHPKAAHWGSVGTEIIRYDRWSKADRRVRWRIVLPTEPQNPDFFFRALSVAGSRLFCINRFKAQVYVYELESGSLTGIITPGPEVGGASGWCDMEHGIQAVQRKNGEILLLAEDDWKSKIILYRLPPPAP